jgi:protein SERAC1
MQALVKATLANRLFGDIRNSTHAIIFLGTPHYGSSGAKYGEILANIARALGRGSDTRLVRILRENSPELLKLAGSFSDIYDDFDIFCFYELYPMKMSRVVSGSS